MYTIIYIRVNSVCVYVCCVFFLHINSFVYKDDAETDNYIGKYSLLYDKCASCSVVWYFKCTILFSFLLRPIRIEWLLLLFEMCVDVCVGVCSYID